MGLFSKRNKKNEPLKNPKKVSKELSLEELDQVKAGAHRNTDWCPKVDVENLDNDELTLEELDKVKAGVHLIDEER